MTELVIKLNKLDLWELFESNHQRIRDRIQRPIRLAVPGEIDMYPTIGKDHFAIACKAVEYDSQSPVPFHITGTLEELIERSGDPIFGGEDSTGHRDLIRESTGDQALIVREVNIDLPIQGCARG